MAYLDPNIERTSPHLQLPPPYFYLVQHRDSDTKRHPGGTFESPIHHEAIYGVWITAEHLRRHLNVEHDSRTPFISVFDNERKSLPAGSLVHHPN